jgi:hypothetical protein
MIPGCRRLRSCGAAIAALSLLGGACPAATGAGSAPDTAPEFDAPTLADPTPIESRRNHYYQAPGVGLLHEEPVGGGARVESERWQP